MNPGARVRDMGYGLRIHQDRRRLLELTGFYLTNLARPHVMGYGFPVKTHEVTGATVTR